MKTKKKALFQTGAGLDFRTEDQKAKDYDPREAFASATPLDWREKTIEEVEAEIFATSINQWSTLRCVTEYAGIAMEMAEFLETGKRIIFSRRDIYVRRYNRPAGGMAMFDLFNLMREGACLEEQLASTQKTEKAINEPVVVTDAMIQARKTYASGSSFTWTTWGIDDLARMIDTKVPVCLFWYFDNTSYDEWWNKAPKVVKKNLDLFAEETGRHQATGVSYLLVNGVKHIAVMDSAGQGTGLGKQKNIRFVSEAFIKARNYGAGFAIDKKNLDYKPDPKFTYNFTKNLKLGSTGKDVEALQKILVLEKCLVLKTPTQYFGGMTQAGVTKLQEKYFDEILKPVGLKKGTGMFYESSRKFINKKYAK
mgnify:FL=1